MTKTMHLTWQQSIGIDDSHLVSFDQGTDDQIMVNTSIVKSLTRLLSKANEDGVAISIVSGFRSFDRQMTIWNEKWQGYRPVYSRHGRPLNITQMPEIEKYKAICLWTALPGLSRHHWGTDFDIFATKAITAGHQVQLTPEEFSPKGPCYQLECWLSENLENLGFFRPYRHFRHGVSVEPWHISHIETSTTILKQFDSIACKRYLGSSAIKAKDFVLQQFEHYYKQYFCNISECKR